jgi:hypothetical protein
LSPSSVEPRRTACAKPQAASRKKNFTIGESDFWTTLYVNGE